MLTGVSSGRLSCRDVCHYCSLMIIYLSFLSMVEILVWDKLY